MKKKYQCPECDFEIEIPEKMTSKGQLSLYCDKCGAFYPFEDWTEVEQ